MYKRFFLSLALLLCSIPLWCQVEPSATGGSGTTSDDDSLMTLPPAVSGSFYPSEVGSRERENTLSGGILFTATYDDNVLAGEGIKTIAAESYTIRPNISVAMLTARLRGSLSYSPGFMFFHPTTYLNEATQNGVADFQFRWTPHTTVSVQDVFQQNSTVFSEPYTVAGATISGSGDFNPIVIAPYAGQIMDSTNAHVGYQFSRNSMIGASGSYSLFDFTNTTSSQGLYNSHGGGGSGSYSRRLGRAQYLGLSYRYAIFETTPYPSTTETHIASAFYSVRLNNNFSLSLSGGPEYATTTVSGAPSFNVWAPSGNASIGWQKRRADIVLSYSRAVTAGWGLLGSFTAGNATALARWQFTQRLVGSLNGSYSNTKNATSLVTTNSLVGHTLFGRASLEYKLGEHLNLVGEYSRVHSDYAGISALSDNPDADRIAISLNYGFQRPLGR